MNWPLENAVRHKARKKIDKYIKKLINMNINVNEKKYPMFAIWQLGLTCVFLLFTWMWCTDEDDARGGVRVKKVGFKKQRYPSYFMQNSSFVSKAVNSNSLNWHFEFIKRSALYVCNIFMFTSECVHTVKFNLIHSRFAATCFTAFTYVLSSPHLFATS